jgi:hypothetical protein
MYMLAVFVVSLVLLPAGALAESNYPNSDPKISDLNAALTNASPGFGGLAAINGQYWPDTAPKISNNTSNEYARARLGTVEANQEVNLFDSLATQSWPDSSN